MTSADDRLSVLVRCLAAADKYACLHDAPKQPAVTGQPLPPRQASGSSPVMSGPHTTTQQIHCHEKKNNKTKQIFTIGNKN